MRLLIPQQGSSHVKEVLCIGVYQSHKREGWLLKSVLSAQWTIKKVTWRVGFLLLQGPGPSGKNEEKAQVLTEKIEDLVVQVCHKYD